MDVRCHSLVVIIALVELDARRHGALVRVCSRCRPIANGNSSSVWDVAATTSLRLFQHENDDMHGSMWKVTCHRYLSPSRLEVLH